MLGNMGLTLVALAASDEPNDVDRCSFQGISKNGGGCFDADSAYIRRSSRTDSIGRFEPSRRTQAQPGARFECTSYRESLAACGGDDDDDTSTATSAPAATDTPAAGSGGGEPTATEAAAQPGGNSAATADRRSRRNGTYGDGEMRRQKPPQRRSR